MARRGALTALQAVLAGVSGGAQGYVQQQELERKRQQERAAQERQQAMDLITFGERAIEPGPLATRAPMGAPRAEAPRTALPTSAVPLPTGPMDFGGAMRQLEQEEARPSGTTPLRIGDITLNIPIGQRARDIKRSEALLAERGALDAAVQQAEAVGAVKTRQEREAGQEAQRMAFNELRALGQESGEFEPNRMYTTRLEDFLLRRRAREAKSSAMAGDLSQLVVQRASALRDDFRSEPAVKKAETIADATRLVRAAAESATPAGDISLVFAYMRVLDPNSTVKTSEYATAEQATNVPDQIRNLYNRLLQGTRLNDRQRMDFVARSNDIAREQSRSIQAQISRFGRISERYGVPSDLVVYDPFEGLFEQAEPAPAIGGTGGPRDVVGGMPEMSTVTPSGRRNPFGN